MQGAVVRVTDPAAIENCRRDWPQLDYVVEFGKVVARKRVLDGRNALSPTAWEAAGWAYRALGRRAG